MYMNHIIERFLVQLAISIEIMGFLINTAIICNAIFKKVSVNLLKQK